VSKDIELVPAAGDSCGTGEDNCVNVVLSIKGELEFILKPVHSLLLEVEVRCDDLIYKDIFVYL
jgi:hypothetical protein